MESPLPSPTAHGYRRPCRARGMLVGLTALLLGLAATGPLRAQYRVVHLEKPFNTPGSETGAIVVGDTILAYATMQQQPSRNSQFHMTTSHTQLMQARIAKNGKVARPRPNRWGLNAAREHTSNLCVDPLTHDLYFTRADLNTLEARIYFARKRKRGWDKPVEVRGLHLDGFTATQPSVGRTEDSTCVLYFASDRPGGSGGMDIWYAIVENGRVQGQPVNLGPQVNSPADEITPFFDQPAGVLYFSSDRPGGLGGHDIYCAAGGRNTWREAEPVCHCLNSEYNDIYFTVTDHAEDSPLPVAGYLASNRPDSYFLVDSTCCNDLYRWSLDSAALAVQTPGVDTIESIDTIRRRIERFMFPLFLYFHNDEPDPMSRSTATTTAYPQCQSRYAALRGEYLARQHSAGDSALVEEFFDSCVVGNYARVEQLFDYVESLLDEGLAVDIAIAGYASPVFHSEYNQVLSERRINSFINMIRSRDLLGDALESRQLTVTLQPHGAVAPTTQSASADPVYGLPAMLARRIEILSCTVR